jgi:hypothetical protein
MTTVSTVAGMIPVAFSSSDGAEFRIPMGVLSIGGNLSSTLLTLVVVPVAYTLVGDLRESVARVLRRISSDRFRLRNVVGRPPVATPRAETEPSLERHTDSRGTGS